MTSYYREIVWSHGETRLLGYQNLFEGCLDCSEIPIEHFGAFGSIPSINYVYRWYVKNLTHSANSMLIAKKLQGNDISIINRELWEIQHLIDHKRFLESDITIEDIRKLSGVKEEYKAKEPIPEIDKVTVLGRTLSQQGFTTLSYRLLTSVDVSNMPDNGFVLDIKNITEDEFLERIEFLNSMNCQVVEQIFVKYKNQGTIIMEQLGPDVQLRFKLKFGDPDFVGWFYNDYIESLRRNAGVPK